MNKLNIFFTLTPAFNPNDGGVQRTTFKLGKKFTELGHSVFYFSLSNTGNIDSKFGSLYHSSEPGYAENDSNLKELKAALIKTKPDFVINQMPYEKKLTRTLFAEKDELGYILLGCLRNSLFSVKNNMSETSKLVLPKYLFKLFDNSIGLYLLLQIHRFKHKKQLKEIIDLHDEFILLAPPNIKELNYFIGNYKKEKIKVIPNSIPEVYQQPLKKEKVILHVGRLNTKQKRSDLLLEFWKRIHNRLHDWEFIIVGDGPYMESIENEIREEKLPRVKLLGYQKPEEWYKKASLFVMTSAYEGFPNVILEAQSFGCIPVAFESYDAISWIVNNKKDAILIKPFDVDEMSNQVVSLIKGDQIQKMALECKNNASKFVIDRVALEWIGLFEKLKKNDD